MPYFIDYFTEEMKGDSATRQVLSYMILKDMTKFVDPAKLKLDCTGARRSSISSRGARTCRCSP